MMDVGGEKDSGVGIYTASFEYSIQRDPAR